MKYLNKFNENTDFGQSFLADEESDQIKQDYIYSQMEGEDENGGEDVLSKWVERFECDEDCQDPSTQDKYEFYHELREEGFDAELIFSALGDKIGVDYSQESQESHGLQDEDDEDEDYDSGSMFDDEGEDFDEEEMSTESLKKFSGFKKMYENSSDNLKDIIDKLKIRNYTFNDDQSIDVNGNVNLSNRRLTKLPIKFRNVSGDFDLNNNELTSLDGCPETVGGYFSCNLNKLTSLEGSPKTVGYDFYCSGNKLTSLKGGPETVGRDFSCSSNKITSLEGCPEIIVREFYCFSNKLTSLEGGPKTVGGNFYCYDNNLTSLVGSPKTVGANFNCSSNKLTSTKGIGDVKGEINSDI